MQQKKQYPLFKTIGGIFLSMTLEMPYFRKELGDNPELETSGAGPDAERISGPKGLTIRFDSQNIYDVSKDISIPDNMKEAVVEILKKHPNNGRTFREYDPKTDPATATVGDLEELARLREEERKRKAAESPGQAARNISSK